MRPCLAALGGVLGLSGVAGAHAQALPVAESAARSAASQPDHAARARDVRDPVGPQDAIDGLLAGALPLFRAQQYDAARALLLRALQALTAGDARFADAQLLAGICAYRRADLDAAEAHLRLAAAHGGDDTRASARIFLALVFSEQGAADQARTELGTAAGTPSLRDTAERLLRRTRAHRLQITLMVSPEFDGNVPLTPLYGDATGLQPGLVAAPGASMDGDVLFLASLGVRPTAGGLLFGNTLSYRQQLRLTDYDFLLDSTWLQYGYFTPNDRLRLSTALNVAMLGTTLLHVEGQARVAYRRRIRGKLGTSAAYDVRYRDYRAADYTQLSGLVQSLQVDLGWGIAPQPVSMGIGYQGLREQTQTPEAALPIESDFRAWGHGPLVWLRARLHTRVELGLSATFVHRLFDSGRVDHALYGDLSLNVALTGWLSTFLGGTVVYNHSSFSAYHFFKPTASAGLALYFGLL